jgi:hypothetical protein
LEYFENLYSNKLENKRLVKFLDVYNQPKLNQEDTNHLNVSVTSNEIEGAIEAPKKKYPGFTAEFYQTFKEIIPTLLNLCQEIERAGMVPMAFYEANITLIPKLDKGTKRNEL